MKGKIRVVIVDDSALVRGLLRVLLENDGGIEVIGEAANGRQAVELAHQLRPDLITMDLQMPLMNGMDAIEEIMCSRATPILVVSSTADAQNAIEAVARGALEVIGKPEHDTAAAAEFVARVRLLAGVSVITRLRPRRTDVLPARPVAAAAAPAAPAAPFPSPLAARDFGHIFAIAASTGGPQALAQLLPLLPADFPAPVLVAQHISDGFAQGMADWLATLCKLPVRLACEGEPVAAGIIHLSPSERHLAVRPDGCLTLRAREANDLYRPSCDVLLRSVADVFGPRATGIILSGMGHDGAAGLAAIVAAGGAGIAQDEASSVIYGMNRVAVERGAARRVLPPNAIAAAMVAAVSTTKPSSSGHDGRSAA